MFYELSYWRLAGRGEVDFILGDMECAIEAEGTANISTQHLHGLRELKKDYPRLKRRIVVSLVPRARRTDDGIDILPVSSFLAQLWEGELIA